MVCHSVLRFLVWGTIMRTPTRRRMTEETRISNGVTHKWGFCYVLIMVSLWSEKWVQESAPSQANPKNDKMRCASAQVSSS